MDRRGVKGRRTNPTVKRGREAKAAVNALRADIAKQNRVRNEVIAATSFLSQVRGRGLDNKFFDPFTANGLKQLDCSSTATLANSAGGYLLTTAATPGAIVLNQIPQGTTQNTRLGRKLKITGIRLKGVYAAAAATTWSNVGWLLVHQKTPNNPTAMPNYTDILVTQNINSLRNVDNNDKLRVLRSHSVVITGNAATPSTGNEVHEFDEMIDLKNKEIITEWTAADTTGVYGNMERGALMLYAVSSGSSNIPQIFLSVRLYYED